MSSQIIIFVIISLCLRAANCRLKSTDTFDEELFLKPLPSGHVYSYFQFTTLWDVEFAADSFDHCHLFPRALGEIVSRFNIQELHISLTEGLWRHENWGYPVQDASPGAELWVWFKPDTINIEPMWKELTGALSGLLCASLNFIDTSNSLSPEFSFRPMGVVNGAVNSSFLRYATLPREIVCTENLTPWKKLLPCDSKKGLATLLNAGYIHNTNYHSLGLYLRPVCRDKTCTQVSIELKQTVSLVHDMVILDTGRTGTLDWSIRKLFGMGLAGSCLIARNSKIFVDITLNETGTVYQLTPTPTRVLLSDRGGYTSKLAEYDLKSMRFLNMLNIAAMHTTQRVFAVNLPPVLYANRYIIGYGQERGGIVTKVHNRHWKSLDIVYLENIPWYLPVYLHTLKIVSNGQEIKPVVLQLTPGKERVRPYRLEVVLRLPPRSVTEISIEFDYTFLKWQEYPPDANHGFYIAAAVITAVLPVARNYTGLPQDGSIIEHSWNASREGYLVRLRTETLIITLPTPDFSMPYNVICLACTVVALAFGPLHNITTKRLRLKDKQKGGIVSWITSKFKKAPKPKED